MTGDAAPVVSDPPARLLETPLGPVSVAEEGDPAALAALCLHGIPGSHRDFRYLGPILAERLRVVRVEMPGFGGSPPGTVDTLARWADVVVAVADSLGLRRFTLVAHSFGGGAALLAAARVGARLAGLGLLASMGPRRHRAYAAPRCVFTGLAALLATPGLGRPLTAWSRRFYTTNGLPPPEPGDRATVLRHVRLLASVRFARLAAAAREVTAPALVAHAGDDRLVEPAIARELAALLPRGELRLFPTGGHHLNRTRAAEVGAAVLETIEE